MENNSDTVQFKDIDVTYAHVLKYAWHYPERVAHPLATFAGMVSALDSTFSRNIGTDPYLTVNPKIADSR